MTTAETDLFASPETIPRGHSGPKVNNYNQYVLPHPETGKETAMTRVTTFAKTLSDLYVVNLWQKRMVLKGLTLRPDLVTLATGMHPDEDRQEMNTIAEQAQEAAQAKRAANLGTALHRFTELVDKGETPIIPAEYQPDVDAYRQALVTHGLQIVPEHIERTVYVPDYKLAGTFDRIVRTRGGRLVLGDLKTGRDLKYGWNEISLQLALYAHASHVWSPTGWSPLPKLDRREGYVFHLPVGKGECTVYRVNLIEGWKACALAHDVRLWRARRALAAPLSVSDAEPPPPHARFTEWEDRIDAASSRGELSAVWAQAVFADAWTAALERRGQQRLKQLDERPAGS